MPQLVAKRMHKTAKPQLVVTNKLKAGKHRFRLVVVDDSGNASKPVELEITVKAARRNPRDVIRDRVVVNPDIRDRVVVDGLSRRVTPTPPPTPRRRRVRPTPVTPRRPTRR